MDDRNAEQLLYIDATLAEMNQLTSRGRQAYDSDIAVARACQYNIIRLTADLERLGEEWVAAHPGIPWHLIKGMRNRIAHNYWTVDDDIVWARRPACPRPTHGPRRRDRNRSLATQRTKRRIHTRLTHRAPAVKPVSPST